VQDGDWRVVREGGGSAWLRVLDAKSVVKARETTQADCRIPGLLEQRFQDMLGVLKLENLPDGLEGVAQPQLIPPYGLPSIPEVRHEDLLYWTVTAKEHSQTISDEAGGIITALRRRLTQESLQPSDIISSTIVLRSMGNFQAVNQARFNCHNLILTSNTPRSTVPSLPTPILPRE
jgi:diphthine-ammonia ligase